MKTLKSKDYAIELLRVIACFFVICIHSGNNFYSGGELNKNAVFLACLRADAVAFFWFITGAFLFKKDDYVGNLKKCFLKVIAPALWLILFVFLFNDWIFNNTSPIDSVVRSVYFVPMATKSLFLKLATPVAHTGQLWYVFVYIFVVICSPVIKAFLDKIDGDRKKERAYITISFLLLAVNDISNNGFMKIDHSAFGALIPALIFTSWGYIFYKNKDKLFKKMKIWQCLAGILLIAAIRTVLLLVVYDRIGKSGLEGSIICWYSAFAAINTVLSFVCVRKIATKVKRNATNKIIEFLGSYTFLIYLLHEFVMDFLEKYGVISSIRSALLQGKDPLKLILYYIITGGMIFIISLSVAIVLRTIFRRSKMFLGFLRRGGRRKNKEQNML